MRFINKIRSCRKFLLLGLLLLGLLVVFGCVPGASAKPKGWSGETVANGVLYLGSMDGRLVAVDATSGARLWSVPLSTAKPGGGGCAAPAPTVAIYSTPAVAGDLTYVGVYVKEGTLSRGKVYAFNFGRDEPRWVYPRDSFLNGPIVGGIIVSQDKVYFGAADGKVYALDAADGHKIAEFASGDRIWSTPVIDNNTLYIGSFDKKLYVLDAENLTPIKWREFPTEGAITATPLVYQATVYIGSFDRNLYAVNAEDGSLRWKFQAENWFWARPVAYNNTIYAPSLDGKVYVLENTDTGVKEVAALDLGSPISSSPVLVGDKVIIASEAGRLYSLDTITNRISEIKNLNEKVTAPLSASQGFVYVHTEKDSLFAVELQTGTVREFAIE